jgi:UDP-N-acetylglucosamine--N-acetylmuramyl-(pentapeptide) pyrophosphoryl-undecaprenol N-acetylglucosamine transferase
MKRIVLVGGGSGGHFYPLIAVAEKLNEYRNRGVDLELFYFGPKQYSVEDLEQNGITFVSCPSGKQRKYFSFLNFLSIFALIYGFFVALIKLYVIYPDVIFSKGSYTSVPVTLAGYILKIPIVIHESDTKPGTANKLASKFARYIAISFDDVARYFPKEKIALTGIPLRRAFIETIDNPIDELGLPKDKPMIFITGGSFGADRLNNLVLESLDELLPNYVLLHQTGSANYEKVKNTATSIIRDSTLLEHYFVKGSLSAHEMNLAESASVLIITRAGAGAIFEIAQKGKPSILIPIPEGISHDQKNNAYAYARSGAATVLEESNSGDGLLAAEITRIMGDQEIYNEMSTAAQEFSQVNAAEKIADVIIGISQEHG